MQESFNLVGSAVLGKTLIWIVKYSWLMAETENTQPPIRLDNKTPTEKQNPNWFREEDLSYVSDRFRLLLSCYGALIGYVVSAFFILYFGKISWLAIGVTVG